MGEFAVTSQLGASRLGHICCVLLPVLRFAPRAVAIEQRKGRHATRLASAASASARLSQLQTPSSLLHPFADLRDAPTVRAMAELCETLGRAAPLEHLVHTLLPVAAAPRSGGGERASRREALWLLGRCVVGVTSGLRPGWREGGEAQVGPS